MSEVPLQAVSRLGRLNSALGAWDRPASGGEGPASGLRRAHLKTDGPTSGKRAQIRLAGGPDMTRKEAWSFYRTISGVRLCWELE